MAVTGNGTKPRQNKRKIERILALLTLSLVAVVWVIGAARAEQDLMGAVKEALPAADHFTRVENGVYAAWAGAGEDERLGYVAIGAANGYGGPVELAVAVDLDGQITGVSVVSDKETPAWFERVENKGFIDQLSGKSYQDAFEVGEDVDGVTGATYTSRGLAEAALDGSRLAAKHLGLEVPAQESPSIKFGVPEIAVLALFAVGFFGHRRGFKYKKQARWGSMLAGLIVLGFLYNAPLTLAYFAKLVLGYWPQWQTNLYWYLLLGGILFVFTVDNKNPYCEWFCPFGAAQECLGLIGGAKTYPLRRHRDWLTWTKRGLALAAILLGVFFRNPGLASFEIFGTLFSFVGSTLQFVVLALVLIAALFVKRPWCHYLCPVDSVVELIRVIRQWVKELWEKINPRKRIA
ncbi:FMN-binding protein [Aggregatilinea lenta]|uniref:FMN-binding protein n=1 Tax=Aggregatilinea lenta TaxID=913108 RepID=UPI000E5BC973|nr:FMN-binding protein [Aggregatilinea lenta]